MHKILSDLPFFVEAAKWKSFTRAAKALDVPLPTLSRRIARLEESLGIQLFKRNRRKVELTEAGKGFFESSEFVVKEAKSAFESLLSEQRNHVGRIRVAMPGSLYFLYMQGSLSSFAAKYPGIEMHVHFVTRWVDLYSESYDLDIRTGSLPDSDLIVRKLHTIKMGLYGSRSLLKRFPAPDTPRDLASMPYIYMPILPHYTLNLWNGEHEESIPMRPEHVVNNQAVGLEFLLAGQGIAVVGEDTADRYEQSGEIIRLLPEWSAGEMDINLVRVSGKSSHRVQLFSDHLVRHFQKLNRPAPDKA